MVWQEAITVNQSALTFSEQPSKITAIWKGFPRSLSREWKAVKANPIAEKLYIFMIIAGYQRHSHSKGYAVKNPTFYRGQMKAKRNE